MKHDAIQRISSLVMELPPGDMLEAAIRLACIANQSNLDGLAEAAGMSRRNLDYLITGYKGRGRSLRSKTRLAEIRRLASPGRETHETTTRTQGRRAVG